MYIDFLVVRNREAYFYLCISEINSPLTINKILHIPRNIRFLIDKSTIHLTVVL